MVNLQHQRSGVRWVPEACSCGARGRTVTFSGDSVHSKQRWLQVMMLRLLLGAMVGAGLGFALYKVVGCSSGACPLMSNPIISTIYGSILGALFASSLR